ncbi:hypothetical protein [Aquamicrobium sp. LC103]|uniref:hypothetical protein n=1 Tax=Aquamicrobium sp. LC103 TaxID=1120658 RepID=UPI00063EA0B0|nr:hypothetical protein [Aquamicrobium sp. LC103]TKT82521.1 hypothetical protein XW59_000725 [Aquamicrobium sp. LC103]
MRQILDAAARHGRLLLIVGLAAGIAAPDLALAAKRWIPELIAAMLFLAALRIGPKQALGAARDLGRSVGGVLVGQLALPVGFAALCLAMGWTGPLPTALTLMLAACSISGSPSLTIMTGHDPAPALRLLIVGTALLPLTVLPVFLVSPALGSGTEIVGAAGRLLAVILAAVAGAFIFRALLPREPSPSAIRSLDGMAAILMAVVVIGLMSAVGPAIYGDPRGLAFNLAVAFAANFGLQLLGARLARRFVGKDAAPAFGIVAGNRNIALFLTALPPATTDPLLLFIGCYQIPMYLTPLLLGRYYARVSRDG